MSGTTGGPDERHAVHIRASADGRAEVWVRLRTEPDVWAARAWTDRMLRAVMWVSEWVGWASLPPEMRTR